MENNGDLKNITIDELATMVQNGFNDVTEKMATKIDMEAGFKAINERLDKLQNDRMTKLEDRMKVIEDALAIK